MSKARAISRSRPGRGAGILRMTPMRRWAAVFAALILLLGLPDGEVRAQSFFQLLFGMGSSKPKPQPRVHRSTPNFGPYRQPGWRDQHSSPAPRTFNGSGRYRTMCVRTCDGYYFPISSNARRRDFNRDAKACSSACGSQAKLFYMDRQATDMGAMRGLAGGAYRDLPNAFSYRKALKSGCTCRPMPWSAAERARHTRYAVFEAYRKLQEKREQEARQSPATALAALETQTDPGDLAGPGSDDPETMTSQKEIGSAPADTHVGRVDGGPIELTAISEPDAVLAVTTLGSQRATKFQGDRKRARKKRVRRKASPRNNGGFALGGWVPQGGGSLTWPGDRPRR